MYLLLWGERGTGIIAKEAYSEQAHNSFDGFIVVSSHSKGRNGVDQVDDRCYKASEEITPGPDHPGYIVLQASSVDDKEENTKGQLSL